MKRGPPRAELGIASCPSCDHEVMRVANNKHGFPCAYCTACKTQFAPRAEKGSLALIGRIHTWNNPEAAALMLSEEDRAGLVAGAGKKPGKLPPHLQRKSTSTTQPPRSPSSTSSPTPPTSPSTPPAPAKRWRLPGLDEPL